MHIKARLFSAVIEFVSKYYYCTRYFFVLQKG